MDWSSQDYLADSAGIYISPPQDYEGVFITDKPKKSTPEQFTTRNNSQSSDIQQSNMSDIRQINSQFLPIRTRGKSPSPPPLLPILGVRDNITPSKDCFTSSSTLNSNNSITLDFTSVLLIIIATLLSMILVAINRLANNAAVSHQTKYIYKHSNKIKPADDKLPSVPI